MASIILAAFAGLLMAAPLAAQERFIDVRQAMADALTAAKKSAAQGDWDAARAAFDRGRSAWGVDVLPMITEGVRTNRDFQEYADRAAAVEADLAAASAALDARTAAALDTAVNAAIWGISHHPRGFDVPDARYTVWDWVFALGIGTAFCAFAVWFGLYLRRSYYQRFPRARFVRK